MITLITGIPGSGKTALTVRELLKLEGRPIFCMGIPELSIPHEPAPPIEEWTEIRTSPEDETVKLAYFTFPENTVLVVDEAQRIYRPRSAGSKVPDIVAALETHRHTGIDIWLITQHPGLIDANIRKLISRHLHIHVTPFGRYLLEWAGIGEPDNKTSRELARRDKYKPDPKVFDKYKSAEAHTKVKVRMPWYYYVFFLALISALCTAYYVYQRIANINSAPTSELGAKVDQNLRHEVGQGRESSGKILTSQEYVAQYQERIDGLPHTAPAYDDITKPVVTPEPVGCVKYDDECRCLTQQGTIYQTTHQMCLQLLKQGPFFMPWKQPQKEQIAQVDPGSHDRGPSVLVGGGKPPEWLQPLRPSSADNSVGNAPQTVPQPMQPSAPGRAG